MSSSDASSFGKRVSTSRWGSPFHATGTGLLRGANSNADTNADSDTYEYANSLPYPILLSSWIDSFPRWRAGGEV